MRTTGIAIACATLLLALGAAGVAAQEDGAPEAETAEGATVTGCLSGADGEWTIETEDGPVAVVDEGAGLEAHNGHEVRLTGDWADEEEGTFVANGIEHIAVCDAAGA